MKHFLVILLFALCLPIFGQTSYEELEFEADSTTGTYKPSGKNFVLIRSKRGTSGVNKTPAADAILTAEVTEIVLVFSETESADIAEREEANQERWENLLRTYPELFQFSTTYKNVCQCKIGADGETFKQTQGFYVYINGEVPRVAAEEPAKPAAPPAPAAAAPAVAKSEEKKPAAKAEEPARPAKTEVIAQKEVAAPDRTEVTPKDPPPAVKEPAVAAKAETPAVSEEKEAKSEPVAAAPKKKPAGVAKPRRAKDPKACRVACYQGGDEDLHTFFKDNLKLSKKQRKSAKKQTVLVKLQLNVDGSIKKATVTCPDEKLNLLVTEALKSMNPWNSSVKSGVSVKSEVKITLKYDKPSKSMKPMEVAIMPRLGPKCKCASDSEIFGD